jgi:hypothetical protein
LKSDTPDVIDVVRDLLFEREFTPVDHDAGRRCLQGRAFAMGKYSRAN